MARVSVTQLVSLYVHSDHRNGRDHGALDAANPCPGRLAAQPINAVSPNLDAREIPPDRDVCLGAWPRGDAVQERSNCDLMAACVGRRAVRRFPRLLCLETGHARLDRDESCCLNGGSMSWWIP